MKKQVLSILGLLMLVGCGSKYESNEQLGEIPSVYMVAAQENQELQQKQAEPADYQQVEQTMIEDAQAALEKVKGQEVYFSLAEGTENPNFEIESVVIDDLTAKTGALALRIKVKALKDHKADANNDITFYVVNQENQATYTAKINPYADQPVIFPSKQIPFGKVIKAGDYCNENGTTFMLYCASYDFTGFKQIMFVPKG